VAPWKLEARVPDGTLHALTALADAGVREPHHGNGWQSAVRDIDLDTDRDGFDAEECRGTQDGQHGRLAVQTGDRP
jgi:hypothetical protein